MGSWKERYDSWHSCAQGVIERFAHRQQQRERTATRQRIVATGFTISLLVFGVVVTIAIRPTSRPSAETHGDLTCQKALELLHGYDTDSLPADKTHAVARHLKQCDSCREMYLDAKVTGVWPDGTGGGFYGNLVGDPSSSSPQHQHLRPATPR